MGEAPPKIECEGLHELLADALDETGVLPLFYPADEVLVELACKKTRGSTVIVARTANGVYVTICSGGRCRPATREEYHAALGHAPVPGAMPAAPAEVVEPGEEEEKKEGEEVGTIFDEFIRKLAGEKEGEEEGEEDSDLTPL